MMTLIGSIIFTSKAPPDPSTPISFVSLPTDIAPVSEPTRATPIVAMPTSSATPVSRPASPDATLPAPENVPLPPAQTNQTTTAILDFATSQQRDFIKIANCQKCTKLAIASHASYATQPVPFFLLTDLADAPGNLQAFAEVSNGSNALVVYDTASQFGNILGLDVYIKDWNGGTPLFHYAVCAANDKFNFSNCASPWLVKTKELFGSYVRGIAYAGRIFAKVSQALINTHDDDLNAPLTSTYWKKLSDNDGFYYPRKNNLSNLEKFTNKDLTSWFEILASGRPLSGTPLLLNNALLAKNAFGTPNLFACAPSIFQSLDPKAKIATNFAEWKKELSGLAKYYCCDYLTGRTITRRDLAQNRYLHRYWEDMDSSTLQELTKIVNYQNIKDVTKCADGVILLADDEVVLLPDTVANLFTKNITNTTAFPLDAQNVKNYTKIVATQEATTGDFYIAAKTSTETLVVHKIGASKQTQTIHIPFTITDLAMDNAGHLAVIDAQSKEIWWAQIQNIFNNQAFYNQLTQDNNMLDKLNNAAANNLLTQINSYQQTIPQLFTTIDQLTTEIIADDEKQKALLREQALVLVKQHELNSLEQQTLHKELILCTVLNKLSAFLHAYEIATTNLLTQKPTDKTLRNQIAKSLAENTEVYALRKKLLTSFDATQNRFDKTCQRLADHVKSTTTKLTPAFSYLMEDLTDATTLWGKQLLQFYQSISTWPKALNNASNLLQAQTANLPANLQIFTSKLITTITSLIGDTKKYIDKKETFLTKLLATSKTHTDIIKTLKIFFADHLTTINDTTLTSTIKLLTLFPSAENSITPINKDLSSSDTAAVKFEVDAKTIARQLLITLEKKKKFLLTFLGPTISSSLSKQQQEDLSQEAELIEKDQQLVTKQINNLSAFLQQEKAKLLSELKTTTTPSVALTDLACLNNCLQQWYDHSRFFSPQDTQAKSNLTKQATLIKTLPQKIKPLLDALQSLNQGLLQGNPQVFSFLQNNLQELIDYANIEAILTEAFGQEVLPVVLFAPTTNKTTTDAESSKNQEANEIIALQTAMPSMYNELAIRQESYLKMLEDLGKGIKNIWDNILLEPTQNITSPKNNLSKKIAAELEDGRLKTSELHQAATTILQAQKIIRQKLAATLQANIQALLNHKLQAQTNNNATKAVTTLQNKLIELAAWQQSNLENLVKITSELKKQLEAYEKMPNPSLKIKKYQDKSKELLIFTQECIIDSHQELLLQGHKAIWQNILEQNKLQKALMQTQRSISVLWGAKALEPLKAQEDATKKALAAQLVNYQQLTKDLQAINNSLAAAKQEWGNSWNQETKLPIEVALKLLNYRELSLTTSLKSLQENKKYFVSSVEKFILHGKELADTFATMLQDNLSKQEALVKNMQAELQSLAPQKASLIDQLAQMQKQVSDKLATLEIQITTLADIIKKDLPNSEEAINNLKNSPKDTANLLSKLAPEDQPVISAIITGNNPFSNDLHNYYSIVLTVQVDDAINQELIKLANIFDNTYITLELADQGEGKKLGLDNDKPFSKTPALLQLEELLKSFQILQNLKLVSSSSAKITSAEAYQQQVSDEDKALVSKSLSNLDTLLSKEEANLFHQELWSTVKAKIDNLYAAVAGEQSIINGQTTNLNIVLAQEIAKLSSLKNDQIIKDLTDLQNNIASSIKDLKVFINENLPSTLQYLQLRQTILQYEKRKLLKIAELYKANPKIKHESKGALLLNWY